MEEFHQDCMIQYKNTSYKLVAKTKCILGEGLHWDEKRNLIWLVDIEGKTLISVCIKSQHLKKYRLEKKVSWAIPNDNDDSIILGLQDQISSITFKNEFFNLKKIVSPFLNENMRLNDAKADSLGRIWGGSMNFKNPQLQSGELFLIDLKNKEKIKTIDKNYNITNGPAFWNDDYFLHNDSLKKITYKYIFTDFMRGISKRVVWKTYEEKIGNPDGMCFDANENILVSHWGTGNISVIDKTAQKIANIVLPTPFVTNICFAGKNLERLFVTTAKKDPNTNKFDDNEGNLFEILGHGSLGKGCYNCTF